MRLKRYVWLLLSTLALVPAANPLLAEEEPQPLEATRDFHLSDLQLAAFVEELLGENPEIRAAGEYSLSRLERAQQERSLPDPQLAYRLFLDTPETRVGPQEQGIEISQGLPWFGSRRPQCPRRPNHSTIPSIRSTLSLPRFHPSIPFKTSSPSAACPVRSRSSRCTQHS